ncbi:MAG TPA: hypothetical protein VFT29_02155 [Gemmatimonadaceae bacterium]|nr:hypothetical protein [Gemmatimonadaceae bacterium]
MSSTTGEVAVDVHTAIRAAAFCCGLAACSKWDNSNGDVAAFAVNDVQRLRDVDVSTYVLDMNLMRQWSVATRALKLAAAGDSVFAAAVHPTGQEPLLRSIRRLERDRRALAILSNAGLTPREYVMTTTAYFRATMADDRMRTTATGVPANVNAANVDFVRQNRAEIDRLLSRAYSP